MSTIKSSAENLTLNADGANNDIKFQSNGVEKASIDQDGKVTAGGASLDGAVTINDTGADVDFRVESDDNGHSLFVEGSTGNILMGSNTNTDDSVNLLVTRDGYASMEIYASENSSARDAVLRLHTRNGGAQCRVQFLDGSGAGAEGGEYYYNHDGDNHIWETAGTQRAQLNSNGLCFGTDTAAANALDDYEEGTWTPDSGGTTLAYAYGSYVKIGNRVFCQWKVQAGSGGATTGDWTGLPFTIKNSSILGVGGGSVSYNLVDSNQTWNVSCENANTDNWSMRAGNTQKQLTDGSGWCWGSMNYLAN